MKAEIIIENSYMEGFLNCKYIYYGNFMSVYVYC